MWSTKRVCAMFPVPNHRSSFAISALAEFAEIVPPAGSGLDQLLVGRGAAYADYDGDGDLDILVSQNQGPALLLRNDTPRQAHYLRVHLRGTRSNRDGIGAEVRVHRGDQVLRQMVRTGRSYYSQNELPLTFGLGQAMRVARVEIVWPSGTVDVYQDVPGDTTLHAVEGKGAHEAGRPLPTQWQGTRPVKLGRSADAVAGGRQNRCPALRRRLPLATSADAGSTARGYHQQNVSGPHAGWHCGLSC